MVCSILLGLVCTSSSSCTLHEMYKQHADNQFIAATDQFIGNTIRNGAEHKVERHSR